jgi:hypothetical protein
MRRRAFLRGAGLAGLGVAVTPAAGHPTATSDGTTAGSEDGATNTVAPLGEVTLSGALELVPSADGETAFVATGDGLAAVDISTPDAPQVVAEHTGLLDGDGGSLQHVWDVSVAGSRVVVAGPAHADDGPNGFVLFDAGDPTNISQVAAHIVDTPIHNCHFDGQYVYLTGNGRPGNPLLVVDADTGEEVGSWSPLDASDRWNDIDRRLWPLHDVWIAGDRAFVAYWDGGTWLLDISDRTAPTAVSRIRGRSLDTLESIENPAAERTRPPGNDHFVTVNDDGTVVGIGTESWALDGEGGPGGIEFYDITTPEEPTLLSTITPPPTSDASPGGVLTTAHNFELSDGYCYSAWYQGGLRVHDMSDPTNPHEVARWRDTDQAALWTVQRGADCLVASSTTKLGSVSGEPAVYTFPDPRDEAIAERKRSVETGQAAAQEMFVCGVLFALLARLLS